jgi:hypothetical protein
LRTAFEAGKAHCLLCGLRAESFYGTEIKNTGGAFVKMKKRKRVAFFFLLALM